MQPVDTGSVEGALTLLYAAACLLGLVTLLMPMDPEIDISGSSRWRSRLVWWPWGCTSRARCPGGGPWRS